MAKIKNKRIYSDDIGWLKDLRQEYQEYGGFDTSLEGNCLTIYAVSRNAKSRKERKRLAKSRHRTKAHKHNKE